MRPMPPALLAAGLGACLIVTAMPEPALDFLPGEPVAEVKTKKGVEVVYTWPGYYFDELPKIEAEMRQHGYDVHTSVDPYHCVAFFSREDGSTVRVSSGKWQKGAPPWGLDPLRHDYISAQVNDTGSLARFWATLAGKLRINR